MYVCSPSCAFRSPVQASADELLARHRRVVPELSRRRAQTVEDAMHTVQDHVGRRRVALRDITADGKAAVYEADERKRLAVDASAYIKHFKAMLVS
jgi:hypothetical protein